MSQATTAAGAASTDEPWTIQRLLAWTREWLTKQGSATPRLDGELLLAHVLKCRRLDLLLRFDQPVTKEELAAYKTLLKRRAALEPVAYILGRRAFHAIDVAVSAAVLVPRPETESLVDEALAFLLRAEAPAGPVLDLCTGSGCIALAVAHGLKTKAAPRLIIATDSSEPALAQARRNADELGYQVEFHRGDLLEAVPAGTRFAAVVTNPPYVRSGDIAKLDRDVRDYEPVLALDGGRDGLDLLRRIVQGSPALLLPGGLLAMEMGSRAQADTVVGWCQAAGLQLARPVAVLGGPTHLVLAQAQL